MKLSIIIPNMNYDDSMFKNLNILLTMLNNQSIVKYKDTVEILLVNEPGKSVDISKYPKLIEHVIQINTAKTITKGLNEALNLITGKYVTFIEPYCSVKNTTSISRILKYVDDDTSMENLQFGVNDVMWNDVNRSARRILGKVFNVKWMKDNGVRLDTNEFINPLYYLAATIDCRREQYMYVECEEFMYLTDNFVEMTDERLKEIASIEAFTLSKKCDNYRNMFLNSIIEACHLASLPLVDAPISYEPKIRAIMISAINRIKPISVSDLKSIDNLKVPGDDIGKESDRLNRFLTGVLGGVK